MELKFHLNFEMYIDIDGVNCIVDITPDWLWKIIPDQEQEAFVNSGDYCKGVEWHICGKIINILFLQDFQHRVQRRSDKKAFTPSPTAIMTSPTRQITSKNSTHASLDGEEAAQEIEDLLPALDRAERLDVRDFTRAILHRQLSEQRDMSPKRII